MPRYAPNRVETAVKRRYFELLRLGYKGAAAAREVGVSTSCGSLWFIDAGSMIVDDPAPISPRFLTQDDRIAIADGLHAGRGIKQIAAEIGKSFQSIYREIQRNSKPAGRYQPWWAHNQALLNRRRPKAEKIRADEELRNIVREKLTAKWSPQQTSRFLVRTYPDRPMMQACPETIYRALYAGLLGFKEGKLRTGRKKRKAHRRGVPVPNKIKNMTLVHQRPLEVKAVSAFRGGGRQPEGPAVASGVRWLPRFQGCSATRWDGSLLLVSQDQAAGRMRSQPTR